MQGLRLLTSHMVWKVFLKNGQKLCALAVVEIMLSSENRLLILLPLCIPHKQGYAALTNGMVVSQTKERVLA